MCRPEGYIFVSRFGLKTGLHFAHLGLESGIVFDGTTGVYERICYFSFKMNTEKGRIIYKSKWIGQGGKHQRELTQFVCVTDCYFIVNVLDLLFA